MTAAPIEEHLSEEQKLAPCPKCGRTFLEDRIEKHAKICENVKENRKMYDIASKRVAGTDTEKLVKAGKVKLVNPKPRAKNSELTKKLGLAPGMTPPPPMAHHDVLPPIKEDKNKSQQEKDEDTHRNMSYQVMFDHEDKMKMRKTSRKFSRTTPPQDDRYLSAHRGRSSSRKMVPSLNKNWSNGALSSDDEDFLAASFTSTKTVCSDAFDFIFDENNLNPAKVFQQGEVERYTEAKLEQERVAAQEKEKEIEKNKVTQSQCCVVS